MHLPAARKNKGKNHVKDWQHQPFQRYTNQNRTKNDCVNALLHSFMPGNDYCPS